MKKLLLATAAVAAMSLPASAAIGVTEYPLPSPVVSVNPAQGLINLHSDVNPWGCTQVTIAFPSNAIEVNRGCEAPIQIFIDGNETPDSEIFASKPANVYTDGMGGASAAIQFNKKYNNPGLYHIVIPEGIFSYDGQTVPQIELGYEVYVPCEIKPAPGVYDTLSEFTLVFPDYNEVEVLKTCHLNMTTPPYTSYSLAPEIVHQEGVDPNVIKFTIKTSGGVATEPGEYTLQFDEGCFRMTKYGPQYYENPNDKVQELNQQILRQYYIKNTERPAINPVEGEIESMRSFTLTFNDDFSIMMFDDKSKDIGVYKVLPDGSMSTDLVYNVMCTGYTAHTASFSLCYWSQLNDQEAGEWKAYRAAQKLEPGKYCLYFPPRYFTANFVENGGGSVTDENGETIPQTGKVITSDPYFFYYEVPTPIFDAEFFPAADAEVDEIADVVMTFPQAQNMADNGLCIDPVTVTDEAGQPVNVEVWCAVQGSISPLAEDEEGDGENDDYTIKAVLTFIPEIRAAGTYTVSIPAGKFISGNLTSPAYSVKYKVTGKLNSVDELAADGKFDVYTLSGIKVAKGADSSIVANLPSGFYIINGRKLVVRH